jgi:hypothetical protein
MKRSSGVNGCRHKVHREYERDGQLSILFDSMPDRTTPRV